MRFFFIFITYAQRNLNIWTRPMHCTGKITSVLKISGPVSKICVKPSVINLCSTNIAMEGLFFVKIKSFHRQVWFHAYAQPKFARFFNLACIPWVLKIVHNFYFHIKSTLHTTQHTPTVHTIYPATKWA